MQTYYEINEDPGSVFYWTIFEQTDCSKVIHKSEKTFSTSYEAVEDCFAFMEANGIKALPSFMMS